LWPSNRASNFATSFPGHASYLRRPHKRYQIGTEQMAFGKRRAAIDTADGGREPGLD
jgi:hypothetical protein